MKLVDALVAAGWLDRSEERRLIFRDWPKHAGEAARKKLQRSGQGFLPVYTMRRR